MAGIVCVINLYALRQSSTRSSSGSCLCGYAAPDIYAEAATALPVRPAVHPTLQDLVDSIPQLLLLLVLIPWYCHLQHAGVSHCNEASPIASLGSFYGDKPQLLCKTPSVLGCPLQMRIYCYQDLSLSSHRIKPQLLSMTPLRTCHKTSSF